MFFKVVVALLQPSLLSFIIITLKIYHTIHTAFRHQVEIEKIRLQFWGAVMSSIFMTQSGLCIALITIFYKKKNRNKKRYEVTKLQNVPLKIWFCGKLLILW